MTLTIVNAILNGEYDKELGTITDAIKHRKTALADNSLFLVKKGDVVSFSSKVTPKYLGGITGTVVKKNAKSFVLDIETNPKARKYSGARGVRCPNSILEIGGN